MRTVLAFFSIIRPVNVAIAGLSILAAALLVQPFHFTMPVIAAMISTMLITAGANVINDYYDLEIDRINRPQRILPAGRLTPQAARFFAIFLFVCGNFFSIFINKTAAFIAAGSSMALVVYSWKMKRQPLTGNLTVSLITALAFIYGALAAQAGLSRLAMPLESSGLWSSDWRAGIFPAVFSFLFHFGREVIKDIEDQAGDRAMRARTLPLAYGLAAAQTAATGAFVLLLIVMPAPFYLGLYGVTYGWIILLGVYPVLISALWVLWKNPATARLRQISAALKADMVVGLAAIYFGR